MNINIKSFAHLRLALGSSPMALEVADGATVSDLLAHLGNHYGDAARTAIWTRDGQTLKVTPVIDGKVAAMQDTIREGATVVFMSNVAGGELS
jgi:molybdopterin converting factor small subunit